ncbi:MAG: flagellar biosynthesis protein FlhB [Candidatus Hydrogenedentota bacterium]
MPDDSGGEKTIPATPRKREQQREEGNIAKSQDLNSAWALGVALLAMLVLGPAMLETLLDGGRYFFGHLDEMLHSRTPIELVARRALYFMAVAAGPFMVAMLLSGLSLNFVQVGFILTAKPLVPKFSRLNPISGLQRYGSIRTLVELVKSLAKLGLVGFVAWITIGPRAEELVTYMTLTPYEIVQAIAWLVFALWWRVVVAMLLIGLIDYAYQLWQHGEDIKMTDREFRDEQRQSEGDPKIKQRVRQLQRQMAMQRMMAEVPAADVVITNPVRYAVALRYDMASMDAPRVVAKGMRLTAQHIRDIATENDVPIVQRPELARTLYRSVEVGQQVPEDFFRAVAEVLSFVYRIDRRDDKRRERERTMHSSQVAV